MNLYSRTSKTKDESEHIKINALFFPANLTYVSGCHARWHCTNKVGAAFGNAASKLISMPHPESKTSS
jgi:hypothetical protein